ncbi:2850_t:CDS:2 [Funneliformis caledonium]|uniref:Trimethylguanosine synthase n=1 Tax=Funneliformis caledonium TaxID=1117310 RepID=A0A9N9ANQ7_9GLOM|nr:2850_t:CDS:2 [Funneliformis caledonium]
MIFKRDSKLSRENDSLKQPVAPTNSKHLPPELKKYWNQRYLLFSLYDEGIMIDEEGWYSVTPEYLAEYIAKRCACDTIIDAMCGVGGNTIQFAKTCKKVIAIDIDEKKLHYAKNNASIYGVEDNIEFILGDVYDLIPKLKADVVFLSPPWGGPSYLKSKGYDIKTMIPVDGERLFRETRNITKNIAYYVPKSINFDQMRKLCDPDEVCEFQQVIVWEKIKSYVAYYGNLVGNHSSEVIKVPKYWANDTSDNYIQSEENYDNLVDNNLSKEIKVSKYRVNDISDNYINSEENYDNLVGNNLDEEVKVSKDQNIKD